MRPVLFLLLLLAPVACNRIPPDRAPIELVKVGTLAGPAEDGGFEGATLLSSPLGSGERIAITPWVAKIPPVLMVDSAGQVTDTLATIGQGPGQVERPVGAIRGLGDTIFILDAGRIHLFAPDHHYLRSIPIVSTGAACGFQHPDGDLILASSWIGGTPKVVTAFSSSDGRERWSIQGQPFTPETAPENRLVAGAPDGTIWTVRTYGKLALQQYSTTGTALRTLAPEAAWFLPYARNRDPAKNAAPNSVVTGFWIDSLGRGWVVAQTADPRWASAEGTMVHSEGQEFFQPKSTNDVRDGIIEVIDLATGDVLTTWRRNEIFGLIAEPGLMYQWRSTADGWLQMDLYRVTSHF